MRGKRGWVASSMFKEGGVLWECVLGGGGRRLVRCVVGARSVGHLPIRDEGNGSAARNSGGRLKGGQEVKSQGARLSSATVASKCNSVSTLQPWQAGSKQLLLQLAGVLF